MAKTVSEQDLQLRKRARRRLIGAIAVVLVVVIFLPMMLDREPRPVTENIEIQIPSPDKAGAFNSKIVPIAPKSAEGIALPPPAPVAEPLPSLPPLVASVPAPVQGKVQPPPAPVATPAPAAKPKAAEKPAADKAKPADKPKATEKPKTDKSAKAVTPAAGFVVQVAALTDAAKAKQIEQRMAEAGVKAYTELLPTAKGNVTRVRAGPYKTREEAEKARDKLKSVGLSGNVVAK